jgi:hypothetical protein
MHVGFLAGVMLAASIAMKPGTALAMNEGSSKPLRSVPDSGLAPGINPSAQELQRLLQRWERAMRLAYGYSDAGIDHFRHGYASYPPAVLARATEQPTLQGVFAVLDEHARSAVRPKGLSAYSLNATRPEDAENAALMEAQALAPKALGDDSRDLVFIPITPCTVWDSRFASDPVSAGIIGNGQTRRFVSHGFAAETNFTNWGGNSSCPQASQDAIGGHPYAVVMTVYVSDATSNGWLTFYRADEPDPSLATISVYYSPGPTRTHKVISKSTRGYGNGFYDIAVTGRFGAAHASASVTGYFIKPQASALSCGDLNASGVGAANIAPNSQILMDAPQCGAGFTRVGISCRTAPNPPLGVVLVAFDHSAEHNNCKWRNQTGAAVSGQDFSVLSRCCRTPGR